MSTDKQRTQQSTPTSEHVELDIAFEDAGGLSPAEYQKPAPGSLIPKTVGASQSLAAAVSTLVGVVGRNESQLLASLEPNDYQKFVESLETLTAIVGEDRNHLSMDSIGALIEKIQSEIEDSGEEGFRMNVRNYPMGLSTSTPHRPDTVGRPAARPHVKLADLLAQVGDDAGSGETKNVVPFKPHRPDTVGRPAARPHVKLADLLAQVGDDAASEESEEIDTGTPVGNEIW